MPKPTPVIKQAPYRKPQKLVEIYQWIEAYIASNHYPPTIIEMVEAGLASSTSVIRYYFDRMTEENMIEITPRISRGMHILPPELWTQRVRDAVMDMEMAE